MGTPQKTFKFKTETCVDLDGSHLSRVDRTKFLGVIIDENLLFKYHIEAVSNTISSNVGILNKLKHFLPRKILHCIYCSLVQSYLTYGILAWGNSHNIYLDNLLKLQKRAVRYITMSHYRAHSNPLFKELKLLNIYDLYKFYLGIFMFKYSLDDLPRIFRHYFITRQDIQNRLTRNSSNYHLPRNKTTFSSKGIRSTGPHLWNGMSPEIKKANNLQIFKLSLKNNMLSLYI
jgi:hypothetical protein